MEIPVYLFIGFLESGKTKFMQETLADPNFCKNGDRTLVLLFEEGEEELDPNGFASNDVFIESISEKSQLNPDKLSALLRKHRATRVIIEYNGMWLVSELFSALPQNWLVYQVMMFADSGSFEVFNANMRSLVVDKLSVAELVVFNRCDDSTDTMALHKHVRAVSRRCDIIYENTDGSFSYDEIEDPLPFDVNADIIEIADRDYALWYRDLSESMESYDKKTVSFLGMVAKNSSVPKEGFVIGRQIMTCCIDDTAYSGLYCENMGDKVTAGQWVKIEARIDVKKCKLYGKKGPVLQAISVKNAEAPTDIIATFY